MKYQILLIGGNGFVGRVLARELQTAGYSVLLPTRHLAATRDLRLLPNVHLQEADVNQAQVMHSLCAQLTAQGSVINLIGMLHDRPAEPYGKFFKQAHVDLPRTIIAAMKAVQLKRYLHMSALGADSTGPSMYQRSKGDGEKFVKESNLDWTIFRPSVIFGAEDQFINLFVKLTKISPVIPLAHSTALFQPVSVDDVATAFIQSLQRLQTIHQVFDLVGPDVCSMADLVRFAARKADAPGWIIPLPAALGYLQALAFEYGPGPTLMSRDNIASMGLPNVLPSNGRDALTLDFGIARKRLESMLT